MLSKPEKNKRSSKKDIVISLFFAMLFLGLVGMLVMVNFQINSRRQSMLNRIDELKKEIKDIEEKNQKLNKDLNQADSKEQLEKIAREQLGLKKPGEELVVVKKESSAVKEDVAPEVQVENNSWSFGDLWKWITGR